MLERMGNKRSAIAFVLIIILMVGIIPINTIIAYEGNYGKCDCALDSVTIKSSGADYTSTGNQSSTFPSHWSSFDVDELDAVINQTSASRYHPSEKKNPSGNHVLRVQYRYDESDYYRTLGEYSYPNNNANSSISVSNRDNLYIKVTLYDKGEKSTTAKYFHIEREGSGNEIAIDSVTAMPTTLPYSGGSTDININGTNLPSSLNFKLNDELGNEIKGKATGNSTALSASINIPANFSGNAKSYSLALSTDGGVTYSTYDDLITIDSGPRVNRLNLSQNELTHLGGNLSVTIEGNDLPSNFVVQAYAFDENYNLAPTSITGAATSGDGANGTATLTIPANKSMSYDFYYVYTVFDGARNSNATDYFSVAIDESIDITFDISPDYLTADGGDLEIDMSGVPNTSDGKVQFEVYKGSTSLGTFDSNITPQNTIEHTESGIVPPNDSINWASIKVVASFAGYDFDSQRIVSQEGKGLTIGSFTCSPETLPSSGGITEVTIEGEGLPDTFTVESFQYGSFTSRGTVNKVSDGVYSGEILLPENYSGFEEYYQVAIIVDNEEYAGEYATVRVAADEPEVPTTVTAITCDPDKHSYGGGTSTITVQGEELPDTFIVRAVPRGYDVAPESTMSALKIANDLTPKLDIPIAIDPTTITAEAISTSAEGTASLSFPGNHGRFTPVTYDITIMAGGTVYDLGSSITIEKYSPSMPPEPPRNTDTDMEPPTPRATPATYVNTSDESSVNILLIILALCLVGLAVAIKKRKTL